MDDNLLLTGESERFGISVSDAEFSHSIFHKKTKSSAEITIDLTGKPGAIVSSIEGFSLAHLNTDEFGYSFGWVADSTDKLSSIFEIKISSLKSEYVLQNEYQAGLINSREISKKKIKILTLAILSLLNGKRKNSFRFWKF